jgi:hypothetical protein
MLKLWTYDEDDGDYFVAESAEEADSMMKNWFGQNLAELDGGDNMGWAWVSMPDDKVYTIRFEEDMQDILGLAKGSHSMTAAEWCEKNGKGYLFSKNW